MVLAEMVAVLTVAGEVRSFSGGMFKILLSKSDILHIKLDKEGGGLQNGWTGRSIRGGEGAPLAPRPRGGGSLRTLSSSSSFSAGVLGAGVASPLPVVIEDRQLAEMVAHLATMTRRLGNA